jgi:hypothetical protein
VPNDLPTIVSNQGANPLAVFPSNSVAIDALAVNLSVTIGVGHLMLFYPISAASWLSK